MLSLGTMAVVSVLWALVGYSMAFAPSYTSGVIGDLSLALFNIGDDVRPGTAIPELLFALFQLTFAVITPAVISGSIVTKMKFHWWLLFAALWHLTIYCPLAHWVWAPTGWLFQMGLMDFAGGTVIETASGVSAFVLAFWLQRHRSGGRHRPQHISTIPHDVSYVLLGAALLWLGWFGFNAGSAFAANWTAVRSLVNTHLSATMAMVTWAALEWVWGEAGWFKGRITSVGAASAVIVGLVG